LRDISLPAGRNCNPSPAELQNKAMEFGTFTARSLCRPYPFKSVARELAECELHVAGIQEVMWSGGTSITLNGKTIQDLGATVDYLLFTETEKNGDKVKRGYCN
jgi:hypothetical protein